MLTAPGLRRCPKCGYIAELHGMTGFGDCDVPASQIPVPVTPELLAATARPLLAPDAEGTE